MKKELFKVKNETLERRFLGILSPTAIDFLKGLLQMDPNKRLNGKTVFKHKYFSIFMDNNEQKEKEKEIEKEIEKTTTNNVNEMKEINSNNNKEIDILKKNQPIIIQK